MSEFTSDMTRLPEERYRSLFDNAPLGFFVADRSGKILALNTALRDLFRVKARDNIFSKKLLQTTGVAKQFRFCLTRGEPVIGECEIKNGSFRAFVQYYLTPFLNEKKQVAGVQAVVINTTAQKEAQDEFLSIYNYVNALVSGLSPLITINAAQKVEFINDSFASSFRVNRTKVAGKNPYKILKLSARETKNLRQNILKSGTETVSNREFKSGSKTFGYSIFRFGDQVGIILRDISDRKKLERTVARLHSRLIHIQEKERQKLAAELHDSVGQTILAAKLNFVHFQKSPGDLQERFGTGLELIDRASQELREIYSNLFPATLRDLGLDATIRWYARNFLEVQGINVQLKLNPGKHSDPDTDLNLFRIVQEVFANITKHAKASQVRISLDGKKDGQALTIADNGSGFSLDGARNKLAGFGLENIRQRVEDMGGSLKIDSSPGKGSRFRIQVPVNRQAVRGS